MLLSHKEREGIEVSFKGLLKQNSGHVLEKEDRYSCPNPVRPAQLGLPQPPRSGTLRYSQASMTFVLALTGGQDCTEKYTQVLSSHKHSVPDTLMKVNFYRSWNWGKQKDLSFCISCFVYRVMSVSWICLFSSYQFQFLESVSVHLFAEWPMQVAPNRADQVYHQVLIIHQLYIPGNPHLQLLMVVQDYKIVVSSSLQLPDMNSQPPKVIPTPPFDMHWSRPCCMQSLAS